LLGAGHAHAVVLRALARLPLHGARITLVSPELKPIYSGMLPGVVAGHYRRAEAEIDFSSLAERASAEVIGKAVVRLDPTARRAFLEDGSEHAYDIASLNVGSHIDTATIPGARQYAIAARPFAPFLEKIRGQEKIAI